MKITKVNAVPIRMPLTRIFPGSTYEIKVRCTIITEILTDEGYVGRTFLGDNRDNQPQVVNHTSMTITSVQDTFQGLSWRSVSF